MTKPTETELFELVLRSQPDFIEPMLDKVNGEYKHTFIAAQFEVWKVRAELADKEKAELKQMYEGAKKLLEFNTQRNPLLKEIAELQAQINELRELVVGFIAAYEIEGLPCDHAQLIIDKTPAQCLKEHDNEVIERCAKVVDESYAFDSDGFVKEIRALKGKQND